MPNFASLDKHRRLTPWLERSHADYVNGEYGRMLAMTPEKAESYINEYRVREKQDRESRIKQLEFIQRQQAAQLEQPSEPVTEPVFLEWLPSTRKAKKVAEAEKPTEETPAAEADETETPKKRKKKDAPTEETPAA